MTKRLKLNMFKHRSKCLYSTIIRFIDTDVLQINFDIRFVSPMNIINYPVVYINGVQYAIPAKGDYKSPPAFA